MRFWKRAVLEAMGDFVELVDGRRFGVAQFGAENGLPVLALHGAPASRLMFDIADGPAKKSGLRLYCPERPGYGITPADSGATLKSRAQDLAAIADRLGLERFAVLGVSGGGPYAVALAGLLGDRVSGLALVSPMGPIAQFIAAEKRGEIADGLGQLGYGHRQFFLKLPRRRRLLQVQSYLGAKAFQAAPETSARLFACILSADDKRILSQPHVKSSQIGMTLEALRPGIEGGVSDLEIFARPWPVDFGDIHTPTIVWQGSEDRIVPVPVTRWLAGRLANCRLVELEGAGHFWVYDHVDDVLETLAGIMTGDNAGDRAG
ncbi:MAG: alpha/beta hydrolase [Alphaproteobacteria bacterium]|nr:alpha/beta hydrolase [Alphaproteobacteria bacterium]